MRLILTLLLLTLTNPAWAEWVKHGKSPKGIDFYYDPTTIQKRGNFRRVLELQDLEKPDNGELSRLSLSEYDCKKGRHRTLKISAHSEHKGSGKVLLSFDTSSAWVHVRQGSMLDNMLNFVCGPSPPARAEWAKYEEGDWGSLYFDPATIKKRGDRVRVWEVMDLKERDKSDALSLRGLFEYDCKEERRRILTYTGFHGQMASGRMLYTIIAPTEWQYIPPEYAAHRMLRKVICE